MMTQNHLLTFKEKVSYLDEIIRTSKHIVVIGHHNPDGDSVGSATAMHRFISEKGIDCRPLMPSTFPQYLEFLDPDREILFHSVKECSTLSAASPEKAIAAIKESDLIICIDLNSPKRTEGLEEAIRSANCRKVLIDHHPDPEKDLFDIEFSDPSMSSACELLFWILLNMPGVDGQIANLSMPVAVSLATGMITDTNNFCNSVTPSTFRMASLLMERGVNLDSIYMKVFSSYSEDRMKLMGELLSAMTVDRETRCACMVLTRETQKRFHFTSGDSEGFVNLALKIADVETSAFFTEEKDRVRVSLRSKGRVSVNRMSQMFFNGGGHEKAAGGKLEMPISRVKDYFFSSARQFIQKEGITFAGNASNKK